MNGVSGRTAAKILTAIENGTLPAAETERRLENLVEAEIEREDAPADLELIDACEDLLLAFQSVDNQKLVKTILAQPTKSIKRRRNKKARTHKGGMARRFRRIACAGAGVFIFVCCANMVRLQWLSGNSSEDEQQYIIQGKEIEPNSVAGADGTRGEGPISFSTGDLQTALDALDFEPQIPTYVPAGLAPNAYSVNKVSRYTVFGIEYVDAARKTIISFEAISYVHIDELQVTLEQNKEGNEVEIDGSLVYVTKNYERTVCVWSEESVLYMLTICDNEIKWEDVFSSVK